MTYSSFRTPDLSTFTNLDQCGLAIISQQVEDNQQPARLLCRTVVTQLSCPRVRHSRLSWGYDHQAALPHSLGTPPLPSCTSSSAVTAAPHAKQPDAIISTEPRHHAASSPTPLSGGRWWRSAQIT